MQSRTDKCPICLSTSELELFSDDNELLYDIRCQRCAKYFINDFAKDHLERALQLNDQGIKQYLSMEDNDPNIVLYIEVAKKAAGGKGVDVPRSIISHAVRNRGDNQAPLTTDILANILKNNSLPTPAEQANNFVMYLGESLSSPGGAFEVLSQHNPSKEKLYGLLGIQTGLGEWKDLQFIIRGLEGQKIVDVEYQPVGGEKTATRVSMTLDGWQRMKNFSYLSRIAERRLSQWSFPQSQEGCKLLFPGHASR